MPADAVDTVVRLIAIELEMPEDRVRSATSLRGELGMDSIAAANVLFAIEEELGVELVLEDVEHLDDVAEIARVVRRARPTTGS
ncbi:MAG: acyl carrier protein [Deltaproteobacteria bacterium]|nr:acyl carrier protein [Deltaproteobacteria bacterium]